jgi:hypothetical protein
MDLKPCRICDAPGTYEEGGQSIEEHIAIGSTDPWCECECCGNTERHHDWQDSEPLDSPLRRQLAAAESAAKARADAFNRTREAWKLMRDPLNSDVMVPVRLLDAYFATGEKEG